MADIGGKWEVLQGLTEFCKDAPYAPAVVLPQGAEQIPFSGIVDIPVTAGEELSTSLSVQTQRVLHELWKRLEAAGLGIENVAKIIVLLACPKEQFDEFNQAWIQFWGNAPAPARRAHGVPWVPGKGTLIEIDPVVFRFCNYPDDTGD